MPAGLINRSARRSHELKSAKVHVRRHGDISPSCVDGTKPLEDGLPFPRVFRRRGFGLHRSKEAAMWSIQPGSLQLLERKLPGRASGLQQSSLTPFVHRHFTVSASRTNDREAKGSLA